MDRDRKNLSQRLRCAAGAFARLLKKTISRKLLACLLTSQEKLNSGLLALFVEGYRIRYLSVKEN